MNQPFRAITLSFEAKATAVKAFVGSRFGCSTIVAAEHATLPMESHADAAVPAGNYAAAETALQKVMVAAPIQKKQTLSRRRQVIPQGPDKRWRKWEVVNQ